MRPFSNKGWKSYEFMDAIIPRNSKAKGRASYRPKKAPPPAPMPTLTHQTSPPLLLGQVHSPPLPLGQVHSPPFPLLRWARRVLMHRQQAPLPPPAFMSTVPQHHSLYHWIPHLLMANAL